MTAQDDARKRARELWMQKYGMAEPKYCCGDDFEWFYRGLTEASKGVDWPSEDEVTQYFAPCSKIFRRGTLECYRWLRKRMQGDKTGDG